jgi:aromatic-L-amino-acid decarboxylase
MDRLNDSGALFLTHTKVGGRLVLRLCIDGTHTQRQHVQRAWALIQGAAALPDPG